MSSLLPQKWLMSLFTLLLFCIGGGSAWADTEIWKVDFNQLATDAAVTDKSNLSNPSNENYKQMGLNISISHLNYDGVSENIYLQNIGDFRWLKQSGIFYLNQVGSGQRHLIIKNCKAGQKFTITHNGVDMNSDTPIYDAVGNLKNKTISGNTLTYEVVASGDIDLQIGKRALLKEMALYAPATCSNVNHSVWTEGTVGTGSDAYQTAFSQFYELESGKQYHFTFHIAGGDKSYKNWYLQAAKTKAHSGDTGWAELLWVRQDRFGFFDGTNVHLFRNNSQTELNAQNADATLHDDATFINDMKNADVDMTVTYADKKLFVYAKTTSSTGNKYYLTGVKSADNGSDPVQLFFGVEAAKITNLVAEKRDKIYQEKAVYDGGNTGSGTFEINSVDDIIYPYYMNGTEKITYISKGESIKIFSTPDATSTFNGNGNYMDNPRTWTQNDEDNHTFYVKFMFNGIKYVLNGGDGKTEDPLGNVTLPRPTKAGHSFIGWMNAANEILPTAGYAGETKTFDASTTLYALWYKNNCEIDFTSTGPLKDALNKAYAYISENGLFMAGGTSMGNVTIDGKAINSRFGVQTGTNWMYYNGGLYQNNSGNRSYGVNGCIAGEYIVINSNTDPNVNVADAELVSHDGNIYTYKVLKDGGVKFTPSRFTYIYTITVSSPCNHTIWTGGNVADAGHTAGWWNNFSDYYKISKGQTLNFRFTIHGGEKSRDHWTFYAQSIAKHNGDLGVATTENERVILGADGLRGGTKGYNIISFTRNGTELPRADWGHSLEDWANEGKSSDTQFSTDMKNAVVDMTVQYGADGVMNIVATSVVGSNKYELSFKSQSIDENTLYLFFTAQNSWMEGIEHPIKFAEEEYEVYLEPNGTAHFSEQAYGAPAGETIRYEIVGSSYEDQNPSISQTLGSPEYTLNVRGTGWVDLRAIATRGHVEHDPENPESCPENCIHIAKCRVHVSGLTFANPSPYFRYGDKNVYAEIDEDLDLSKVAFKLVKYDTTPCFRNLVPKATKVKKTVNGVEKTITKVYFEGNEIPTDGGIIVVRATTKDTSGKDVYADCCITMAYDLHVWDMYSDPLVYGSLVEGNDKTRDILTDDFGGTTGALDNGMNPQSRVGSAHYVIYNSSNSYTYVKPGDEDNENSVDEEKSNNNRVEYNNWMDGQDYYAKENWFNEQSGTKTCSIEGDEKDYDLLHRHWKFTYKTCTYDNGVRTYVNEPLFAYKNTVIGDNGRIVKQTAGLRFNAPSLKFGVSDNDTRNDEGGNRAIREQDRCVLLQVGSRLCIPRVKEGRYIRIHWYRHSDNNGDRVRITNGEDLDGREIDPRDVIRFTGSHYYEDHKGSFVFKVKKSSVADGLGITNEKNVDGDCCDVFIDPTGIGWTEFYRIEIMDKFESELQICEVDVDNEIKASDIKNAIKANNIGDRYATIDSYNSHDLNSHDAYNRQKFFTPAADDTHSHEVYANRLVSKIRTRAIAKKEGIQDHNDPLEKAHDLWLSGYPGHCYTWNGWLNTTVQAEFTGSAMCEKATKTDSWTRDGASVTWEQPNTIPSERIWVGNRLQYTMHNLEKAWGEGTIKLTFRTHSGWEGEPHYTFDKQQVYVAVGQYSVQKYPYTWDFTNYNFGLPNDYNLGTTYGGMESGVNANKEYGYWETIKEADAVSSFDMWSCHGNITDKIGRGTDGTYHELRDQNRKLNKREFAQGSQLSLGTGSQAHTILETEGLRFYIPAIKSGNDNHDVQLYPNAASNIQDIIDGEDVNKGCLKVKAGTKITIPEVDKNMYVFISGTVAPSAATNTKASDTVFEPNVKKYNNANSIVTYYQATGAADGGKADIELSFNQDAILYKIGVTNQKKAISYFGWSTESRAVDIDYNETRYFSADVESFYVHDATNWDHRSDNFNLDTDLEVRLQGTSEGVDDRLYIPQGTGIVMHDKDCTYDSKTLEDSGAGTSYVVPLFVNACNVPQTNTENYQHNILEASTNKDKKTTTITTTLESDAVQYYTMSNYYVGAKIKDNAWSTGKFYTTTPRFYRYIGAGGSVSSITLENMSFLKVEKPKNVKILNDIISVDFGYGVDTDPTAIEIIGWDGSEINNGIYYNLRGQAINGKPVVPGIYIKNGKKYYVK